MLKFVQKAFRKWFTAGLWITVFGCIIIGLIGGSAIGGYLGRDEAATVIGALLGLVLGALVGWYIAICFGGLVAIFLNIDENLQQLKDHVAP